MSEPLYDALPRLSVSEPLHDALQRLADECAQDDARATKAPWVWTDSIYLWNEEIDRGVLEHGGVEWPMSAGNREVIAASRNRLPELARVLSEGARKIETLEKALERALSTWCPHDPGGDGADGETYRLARGALAKKETAP